MAKYDFELTLYMTIEANSIDEAEEEAEYQHDRLVGNGLAGDLGYEGTVYSVKKQKTKASNTTKE